VAADPAAGGAGEGVATEAFDQRKARGAERSAVWVRLAVVALGTFVYISALEREGRVAPLAYLLLGLAWLYGLSVPIVQPYLRLPHLVSSYFISITDAMFTMLWLLATGGFHSPFYVAIYAAVVSVALRFNLRETAIAAVVYAATYVALLWMLGQLAENLAEVLVRVGFIFVVAATSALLARESFRQARARARMRTRLMRELRLREERYRALFERVPVPLYRAAPDGRILDANEALVEMLGYPDRESLLAATTTALHVDPDARALWMTTMAQRGLVRDFIARLRRFDGSVIWVRDNARAVRDDHGHVVAYEGMLEDVTERRKAEEVLRQNEARLRLLVDQIPALVWTTDRQMRFTSFLGAGLAVLGLRPNQVVGRTLYEVFGTGDPRFPAVAAHREALEGKSAAYEMKWGGRAYQAHVEPLRAADGSIGGTTGVALDVTERVRTEELRLALEAVRRPGGGSLSG
jgi:PAS domain S-box-containing protein